MSVDDKTLIITGRQRYILPMMMRPSGALWPALRNLKPCNRGFFLLATQFFPLLIVL